MHSKGRHFQNGRRQNRQNCNVLWFQWKLISSVILKCRKLLMVSDFNAHWYLWVFWSEELVGNDAICIQGHFYEATNFKMAANKIVKLSTVSFGIMIWGSFGDFCVCIQTQLHLVMYCIVSYCVLCLYLICFLYTNQCINKGYQK